MADTGLMVLGAIIVFGFLCTGYFIDKKYWFMKIILYLMTLFNIIGVIMLAIVSENSGNTGDALEVFIWVDGMMVLGLTLYYIIAVTLEAYGIKEDEDDDQQLD